MCLKRGVEGDRRAGQELWGGLSALARRANRASSKAERQLLRSYGVVSMLWRASTWVFYFADGVVGFRKARFMASWSIDVVEMCIISTAET